MYRYAIIGFGGLGKLHLGNLINLEKERGDIKLQAICGADEKNFKNNVKINLGTVDLSGIDLENCAFYQDYKELIDVEKPDFIISTVPTYLHKDVAVYALNHGVNVFSEKPMALSIEDCEEMISAAKANNKKLMIGQCLRFDPSFTKLKELVDSKTYGNVCRAEFNRYSQTPLWTWNNWILDPEKSGGCVLDMHIHDVDLINWMFGIPESLHSVITGNKVEREAVFTQYFYKDFLVISNADWSLSQTFPFEAKCLVNFEKATVVIADGKLTVYEDERSYTPEISKDDYFVSEMKTFLDLVIEGKYSPITSAESVAESIKLAIKELKEAKYL